MPFLNYRTGGPMVGEFTWRGRIFSKPGGYGYSLKLKEPRVTRLCLSTFPSEAATKFSAAQDVGENDRIEWEFPG